MIPGYHAGELWLHEPARAIERLSELGYRSVAIRSRQGFCVPGEPSFNNQWQTICQSASTAGVRLVIDTEAAFVVDSEAGALPSLASTDESTAKAVMSWIQRWIEAAGSRSRGNTAPAILTVASGQAGASADGSLGGFAGETPLDLIANRLETLARKADELGVVLAIRPAIGHAVASVAQFERLRQWLPGDVSIGLAADIGEMVHAGEMPLVARLQRQSDHLKVVYLCDTGSTYSGTDRPSANTTEAMAIGRMDVPLGTGELAVDRIVGELAKFTNEMPIIVRVAGHAGAGLTPARSAMECLNHVVAWRNACRD